MRIFKQTLILLVIFAGVLGFYFLYLKPSEEKKKKEQEAEKKLINIEQEKIQEIWITKQNGEKIGFRREGKSRWNIIFPIVADADRFAVNPIASRFSSVDIDRLIDDTGNFSPYGLDNPRFIVEIKTQDQVFTLNIGNKSQVGYNVYAYLQGDKKVYLVSAALESVIDKTLYDFREKRPMDFIVSDVKKFIVVQGNKEFLFEKEEEGSEWKILFPGMTTFVEGDESKIRDLLYKISGIKVKEFVSDLTEPVNSYGLDAPDTKVSVFTKGEDGYDEFSIILKFTKDSVYGKRPDKHNIFSVDVDRSLQEQILAENFRNRQVIKYYVWRVKEISVETTHGSRIIQRDQVDTEKWYLVEGNTKKTLETSKVKDVLRKLSEISVLKFVGDSVDVSEFIKDPKARIRIDVEGKAEPYYLIVGDRRSVDGVSGILAGLMDKKSVYIFPDQLTSIISEIQNLQPVQQQQ